MVVVLLKRCLIPGCKSFKCHPKKITPCFRNNLSLFWQVFCISCCTTFLSSFILLNIRKQRFNWDLRQSTGLWCCYCPAFSFFDQQCKFFFNSFSNFCFNYPWKNSSKASKHSGRFWHPFQLLMGVWPSPSIFRVFPLTCNMQRFSWILNLSLIFGLELSTIGETLEFFL